MNQVPEIDAKELQQLISNNTKITLIDVRTPREWKQTGVIPGSVLLSMDELANKLQNGFDSQLRDKPSIIFVCNSGNRSYNVTNYFVNKLNIKATNLRGGVIAWHRIGGRFEQI
ncbi:MAG: rhodanese-like domain-containing protein [Candidatus Heimdallarchaeota archaeon]|nr:rhodanese-like domain-containing protein [Candidatus Heimdallarchaeota archaeon]